MCELTNKSARKVQQKSVRKLKSLLLYFWYILKGPTKEAAGVSSCVPGSILDKCKNVYIITNVLDSTRIKLIL